MALEDGGGFVPHKDFRGFVSAEQFYDALVAKGFTPNAARGILGNLMHESGGGSRGVYLDPPTDAGHYNWGTGDAAVGAAQWEGKRQGGVAPTLQSQVNKIWDEFNNPGSAGMQPGTFERVQTAQSPGEAASLVNTLYERPLNPGASMGARQRYASMALGTTLTSTPEGIVDPSIVARGGTSPPIPEPAAPADAKTPATGWAGFFKRPPSTKDAQGNEVQGKSPAEKLAASIGGMAGEKQAPAEIPALPAAQPFQDPMLQMYGPSQQLFQAVTAAAARPLSWSSRPYGYGAGQQMGPIGTTLNQTDYGYG